jgi:aquaporin Z
MPSLFRKASAEALGTFWLVFAGVGSAVLAGPSIGAVGVAFAFGISVLTMVYALGPISGAHLNPAVSLGASIAGRMPLVDLVAYVLAQLGGAIVAALMVLLIARGRPGGYDPIFNGLGANGYGADSPAGFHLAACFVVELILTFIFVLVCLGTTSRKARPAFAGIAIGLCLAAVHLVSLPITNTSVNPARSTGPAVFVGSWAMAELWLFWVAPFLGAVVAGLVARLLDLDKAFVPRAAAQLVEELRGRFVVPPPMVTRPRRIVR